MDDSVLAATTRARVAHDPENYVSLLPGLEPSALSDNADIPVYDLAGKRITDSADLAKELYDGRWIKMDAELQLCVIVTTAELVSSEPFPAGSTPTSRRARARISLSSSVW